MHALNQPSLNADSSVDDCNAKILPIYQLIQCHRSASPSPGVFFLCHKIFYFFILIFFFLNLKYSIIMRVLIKYFFIILNIFNLFVVLVNAVFLSILIQFFLQHSWLLLRVVSGTSTYYMMLVLTALYIYCLLVIFVIGLSFS